MFFIFVIYSFELYEVVVLGHGKPFLLSNYILQTIYSLLLPLFVNNEEITVFPCYLYSDYEMTKNKQRY